MLMRIRVGKNRVRAVAHADGLSLRDFFAHPTRSTPTAPPARSLGYCAACAIARLLRRLRDRAAQREQPTLDHGRDLADVADRLAAVLVDPRSPFQPAGPVGDLLLI